MSIANLMNKSPFFFCSCLLFPNEAMTLNQSTPSFCIPQLSICPPHIIYSLVSNYLLHVSFSLPLFLSNCRFERKDFLVLLLTVGGFSWSLMKGELQSEKSILFFLFFFFFFSSSSLIIFKFTPLAECSPVNGMRCCVYRPWYNCTFCSDTSDISKQVLSYVPLSGKPMCCKFFQTCTHCILTQHCGTQTLILTSPQTPTKSSFNHLLWNTQRSTEAILSPWTTVPAPAFTCRSQYSIISGITFTVFA